MFHIHYYFRARDCDGPYEHWNNYQPDREGIDWTDDLDIAMNFVMSSVFMVPDPYGGPATVTIDQDESGRYVIEGSRQTDEGFEFNSYTICDRDDLEEGSRQRDHFAEAAGY